VDYSNYLLSDDGIFSNPHVNWNIESYYDCIILHKGCMDSNILLQNPCLDIDISSYQSYPRNGFHKNLSYHPYKYQYEVSPMVFCKDVIQLPLLIWYPTFLQTLEKITLVLWMWLELEAQDLLEVNSLWRIETWQGKLLVKTEEDCLVLWGRCLFGCRERYENMSKKQTRGKTFGGDVLRTFWICGWKNSRVDLWVTFPFFNYYPRDRYSLYSTTRKIFKTIICMIIIGPPYSLCEAMEPPFWCSWGSDEKYLYLDKTTQHPIRILVGFKAKGYWGFIGDFYCLWFKFQSY